MNLVFDRLRGLLGGIACAVMLVSAPAVQAQSFSALMYFNGVSPTGNVVIGHDGGLYGSTSPGGGAFVGLFYRLAPDASEIKTIYQYGLTYDANLERIFLGANPTGQLLLASDGYFYGVTQTSDRFGGTGTIFRMAQDGSGYTKLFEFEPLVREPPYDYLVNDTGAFPQAGLVEGLEGGIPYLYGVAFQGGRPAGTGTIFKIRRDGSNFQVIHEFAELDRDTTDTTKAAVNPDGRNINPDGINPSMRLLLADGRLYGVTTSGGTNGTGVVFSIDPSNPTTTFHSTSFDPSPADAPVPPDGTDPATYANDPESPYFGLNKNKLNETGAYPLTSLVLIGNQIFGTTSSLGGYPGEATGTSLQPFSSKGGHGTLFSAPLSNTAPALAVVFHFTGGENNRSTIGAPPLLPDRPGSSASGDLIVIDGTTIVGTTQGGGIVTDSSDTTVDDTSGNGTIFRYNTASGTYDTPMVFSNPIDHGYSPSYGVVAVPEGTDYAYYGVTSGGGMWGQGVAFKVGAPTGRSPLGQAVPYDDGGGSVGKWLIAALILLAAMQLIMVRHRRSRLKRAMARQSS